MWGLITSKAVYLMNGDAYVDKRDLKEGKLDGGLPLSDFFIDRKASSLVVDLARADEPKASAQSKATGFNGQAFAKACETELSKGVPWHRGIKYTQAFVTALGAHRWSWCAATVHWCVNEFVCKPQGKQLPIQLPGMIATFALVEAWQKWFQAKGWYKDNDGKYVPPAGAVVMFDWDQGSIHGADTDWEDHIGIFLRKEGDMFVCAEGNANNMTAIKRRYSADIQGFGVFPEGWDGSV